MGRQGRMVLLVAVAVAAATALAVAGTVAITSDSTDVINAGGPVLPEASSQKANYLSGDNPTIRVTGSAAMMLEPDQATMRMSVRSQPMPVADALAQQHQGMDDIIGAIREAAGQKDNATEIRHESFGIHRYYIGQDSYSSIETFTIRSTVSIETDIEQFSNVVNRLTEEGYTFESVYAGPRFQSSFALAAGSGMADSGIMIAEDAAHVGQEEEDEYGQITLNVAMSTRPAPIGEAVESYEQKHQRLLEILVDEMEIPLEKIQPASVSIDPLYHGPSNQDLLYTHQSNIIVNTSPENIAPIISATDQYDVFVERVSITTSDRKLSEIEGEINLAAFNDAKAKAQEIAKTAGLGVGGVQSIESTSEPIGQQRTFYGNLYSAEHHWRYTDTWMVGATITVEFEMTE